MHAALIFALTIGSTASADALRVQSLKELREHAVVMQQWETSCAAAAIATVLTYAYGDPVTEAYVVAVMLRHTSAARVHQRGGFSMLDMKRFVETRGYAGDAYENLSLDDLKLFHAPIVPIAVRGFNHYVVVNAIDDREVRIADPAFGNRKMSRQRFVRIWYRGLAFVALPERSTA